MKLFKTSAILFSGSISVAASSLVLGIFTARYLGPESRGTLYLIIQIITIGSLILAGGLGPAYQYYLSNETFSRSQIFSHLASQSCLTVLILGIFISIGGPLFHLVGIENLTGNMIYVIACGIFFNVIVIYINSILMTYEKGVSSLTLLNIGSSLTNTALFVACTLILYADIDIALIAYFVGLLIRMIPGIYIAIRGIRFRIIFNWRTMSHRLFKYGAASFLFNLAVVMVFRTETFILNSLVGLEELGKYAVAVTLGEMVLILPSTIGTALFAGFPTLDAKAQVELLRKACRSVIAITGTICIVLATLSSLLITTLVGEEYIGAIAPFRAILPGLVAMATAYVFANYFAGTGRPLIGAAVFGIGLLVKIGLTFIIAPQYGILGAALASSIAYISIAFVFYLVVHQRLKLTARSLFIPTFEDFQSIWNSVKNLLVRLRRST